MKAQSGYVTAQGHKASEEQHQDLNPGAYDRTAHAFH